MSSMPRAHPALPQDVFLEVPAIAERPEVGMMMSTCCFLYSEGSKAILRRPITIFSYEDLSRFLVFLFAEGPRRLNFVRWLQVNMDSEEAADDLHRRLLVAIQDMSQLRLLSIGVVAETHLLDLVALVNDRAEKDGNGMFGAFRSLALHVGILSPEASWHSPPQSQK
ncbi:hypothetical protein NUW54_g11748 [Trametes sanguinea]|uniref:Uncharacterized protein n=1 Tax=Trametes sanguinea TaxID=158606 RepID=A0ACC1N900_9APHY|nr:hypothetical protein NUW54_g11748 [Trametes sanguinea]